MDIIERRAAIFVHIDPVAPGSASRNQRPYRWYDADPDNHHICRDTLPVGQLDSGDLATLSSEAIHACFEHQRDTLTAVFVLIELRQLRSCDAGKDTRHCLYYRYLTVKFAQHGCCFQPDIAATDDHCLAGTCVQFGRQTVCIGPGSDRVNTIQIASAAGQPPCVTAGCPDELAIGHYAVIAQLDGLADRINFHNGVAQQHVNLFVRPELRGADHDPFERLVARQIFFRQWRAFIRIVAFPPDHGDRILMPVLAQGDCRLCPGMATANDNHIRMLHRLRIDANRFGVKGSLIGRVSGQAGCVPDWRSGQALPEQ